MNMINTIGIRIGGITLILVLLLFGVWKGIELGVSQLKNSNTAMVSPSPRVEGKSTTPLTPQLKQEFSTAADTARETLVGYTKKYVESLPTDIAKDQVLDPKKIEAFVTANQGKLLPDLPAGTVQTISTSGKQAIQTYLDAISPTQNPAIVTVTGDIITSALAKQESNEDLQALAPIRTSVENNFKIFQSVKTPKEAVALHTKLLQATQALINNIKLLQEMRNDTVGGLIGQKNLADLNAVFTDIGNQILALETKYKIK
jgi:hypothetical protein